MRKFILIFCAIMFTGYFSFAQDDEVTTEENKEVSVDKSSGERAIHIAYSPSTSAIIGVHGGLLANSGGVLNGNGLVESGGLYLSARYNHQNFINLDRLSVAIGASLQIIEPAHVFVGFGYGRYNYPYNEPTILPDLEIKGLEIEGGTIINLGKFTIHVGISTIKFEKLDLHGGIGFTF